MRPRTAHSGAASMRPINWYRTTPLLSRQQSINFNCFILWVGHLHEFPVRIQNAGPRTDGGPTTSATATKLLTAFVLKAIISSLYSIFVQHKIQCDNILLYFQMMVRFRWTWKSRHCRLMLWTEPQRDMGVVTFRIIERAGQRSRNRLVDSSGYSYGIHRRTNTGKYLALHRQKFTDYMLRNGASGGRGVHTWAASALPSWWERVSGSVNNSPRCQGESQGESIHVGLYRGGIVLGFAAESTEPTARSISGTFWQPS